MTRVIERRDIPVDLLSLDKANVRSGAINIESGELEASIEEHGVLEPVLVRPTEGDRYAVVVGGRRLHAAKSIGLESIPATVMEMTDEEAYLTSFVENLQRENLDPDTEAEAVGRLYDIYGSMQKVAESVGKERTWVQNRLEAKGIIETVKGVKGVHVLQQPILPRDPYKVTQIGRTARALFPDEPEKQVELFESLKDKPRREAQRALEHVKARFQQEPGIPIKQTVEEVFKLPEVEVSLRFGRKISTAILRAVDQEGLSREDIVRLGTELWLETHGYLEE